MAAPEHTTRLRWLLLKTGRTMWFRAAGFCVVAILTALLAVVADPYIPEDLPTRIGSEAVGQLLEILASSMLAVTIFSLTTLVYAHAWASGNATPRSARLVSEDQTAQNALATFLGTFLFSLVGLIALATDLYGEGGRVVQYAVTLLVIIVIIVTLLRWIQAVTKMGRVDEIIRRVEKRTARAMREHHKSPYLGGRPFTDSRQLPADAVAVSVDEVGYVQNIDLPALDKLTCDGNTNIFIATLPGGFADPSRPLCWVQGRMDGDTVEAVRDAFTIKDHRTFDQDPRFGSIVLTEIALRALSPSMNDPGTAIDVLGRAARLLAIWAAPNPIEADKVRFPFVHVPPVLLEDMFDDFFPSIARDGAAMYQVGVRIQKVLGGLSRIGDARFRAIAHLHSALAMARAEAALTFEDDLKRVREAAAEVARD